MQQRGAASAALGSGRWLTAAHALSAIAVALVVSACAESPTSPSTPVASASQPAATQTPQSTTTTTTTPTPSSSGTTPTANAASSRGHALRFHGNGASEVDRVKIPIDPPVAADIGRDFTIEFWLKAEPGANTSATCQAGSDGWTYGNAILDRDVSGDGDFGEYGVSLSRRPHRLWRRSRRTQPDAFAASSTSPTDAGTTWRSRAARRTARCASTWMAPRAGRASGPSVTSAIATAGPRPPTQDPVSDCSAPPSRRPPKAVRVSRDGSTNCGSRRSCATRCPSIGRPEPYVPDAETALLLHFDEGPAGPCASTVARHVRPRRSRAVPARRRRDARPGLRDRRALHPGAGAHAAHLAARQRAGPQARHALVNRPGRSAGGRRRPPGIDSEPPPVPFWTDGPAGPSAASSPARALIGLALGRLAGTRSAGSTTTRAIGCTNPRACARSPRGKLIRSRPVRYRRVPTSQSQSHAAHAAARTKLRATSPLPRRPSSRREVVRPFRSETLRPLARRVERRRANRAPRAGASRTG